MRSPSLDDEAVSAFCRKQDFENLLRKELDRPMQARVDAFNKVVNETNNPRLGLIAAGILHE